VADVSGFPRKKPTATGGWLSAQVAAASIHHAKHPPLASIIAVGAPLVARCLTFLRRPPLMDPATNIPAPICTS